MTKSKYSLPLLDRPVVESVTTDIYNHWNIFHPGYNGYPSKKRKNKSLAIKSFNLLLMNHFYNAARYNNRYIKGIMNTRGQIRMHVPPTPEDDDNIIDPLSHEVMDIFRLNPIAVTMLHIIRTNFEVRKALFGKAMIDIEMPIYPIITPHNTGKRLITTSKIVNNSITECRSPKGYHPYYLIHNTNQADTDALYKKLSSRGYLSPTLTPGHPQEYTSSDYQSVYGYEMKTIEWLMSFDFRSSEDAKRYYRTITNLMLNKEVINYIKRIKTKQFFTSAL